MYYHTLVGLRMGEAHLTPYAGLLEGFTNHTVHVKGTIEFDVTIGEKPLQKTEKVTFMVIDLQSQYNAILGLTAQAALGIVASVPHQKIKFSTPKGIACIKNKPEKFLRTLEKERKKKEEALRLARTPSITEEGESSKKRGKTESNPETNKINMISFHSTRNPYRPSRKAKQTAPVPGGYVDRE